MGGNELLEQIKAMLLEEYSVSQWVLLFFLYSFCGWCWEVFLYLVKERRFVNRGFLFGPILPIYGFGAVGILLTCVPVEGNMALVALVGTIAASLLEYVTGFLMESIFHVRYWDYSQRPLNLNGYILRAVRGDVGGVLRYHRQRGEPVREELYLHDSADDGGCGGRGACGLCRGGYRLCRPPRPRICAPCWNPWSATPRSCKPCTEGWIPSTNMSAA